MRAAFLERFGGPEVIQYGELPDPPIGPRRVLVRVAAVAVNPIDKYIRSGAFKIAAPLPYIVGRDLAGTVVEVGPEVSKFRRGDRVWANNQGYHGRQGSFSEYVSVDEDLLYPLPAGAGELETVAVVHSALAAVLALQFKAKLAAGETLFVNGGDGNVGTAALAIAKSLGARVAVTAGRDDKAQWCRELGADLVIRYQTEDLHQRLREFAPDGVNVYLDVTRHFEARTALESLARRGRIVAIAGLTRETVLPVGLFYQQNATLFGFTVTDATTDELARYAREINRWIERRVLRPRIALRMPLSEAAEAHRRLEAGGLFGKIVLTPGE